MLATENREISSQTTVPHQRATWISETAGPLVLLQKLYSDCSLYTNPELRTFGHNRRVPNRHNSTPRPL